MTQNIEFKFEIIIISLNKKKSVTNIFIIILKPAESQF